MNPSHPSHQDAKNELPKRAERRRFLCQSAASAAGLVLSVSAISAAQAAEAAPDAKAAEVVLKLSETPELAKVGGYKIIEIGGESVIVARTGEVTFVALSSVCPHRGCNVEYREKDEFYCPCHGSRFALDGKVLQGPARKPLAQCALDQALSIGAPKTA